MSIELAAHCSPLHALGFAQCITRARAASAIARGFAHPARQRRTPA
ncbi:hypothetical protein GLA29479_5055 [Lysobacter antibioticus]|nr:hypothetical protein GLA29479_5055 [Lysobacter antibioticus]